MKSLVLSLLLFFLIGTHADPIPQENDAEPIRPSAQESLKSIFRGIYIMGAELTGMHDSPDSEKIVHLQRSAQSIFVDSYNLFFVVLDTIVDTYKEVDKEIHEHYPTYRTKVIPIVHEYLGNVVKYVVSLKDEILPYITKANKEIGKIQLELISNVKKVLDDNMDKLDSLKEDMNAKIKPFVEQVQQEVKAAKKEESGHKQLNKEQFELYKDVMTGMVTYREDDAKKMFDMLDKYSNKA
ncbi:uncharacterized protein ACMZJ9_019152 [Mantella aurantiaca]